jgi:hypothetical protein
MSVRHYQFRILLSISRRLHSVIALEQVQGCIEATTESISHVMLMSLPITGASPPRKSNENSRKMKDRKIRMKNSAQIKVESQDIRERLELIDKDMHLKLQTLNYIFSGTKDYAEEIHQLYVQPMLESGLTLEDSLEMLVEGVLRPN